MPSSFAWLSYSETERRKALDVLALFRERDTRDELGIGVIRDAFADLFFPGTSTIQTRARYFLFIPWIYQRLEQKRVRSAEIAERARREEVALIEGLCNAGEKDGVIGIEARKNLRRLPSSVYWQGLAQWGLRLFPGSIDQYHRSLDRFYLNGARVVKNDDGEPIDGFVRRNWHAAMPERPENFPEGASMKLSKKEAEYLRERVLTEAPESFLAFLLNDAKPAEASSFPWMHPQHGSLSRRIQEQLLHARNFSETLHGAALLYNFLLAKQRKSKKLTQDYETKLHDWSRVITAADRRVSGWDRARFWELAMDDGRARVPTRTRQFVNAWIDLLLAGCAPTVTTSKKAQALIQERERALKRAQSRFDNPRALELWRGAAGASQLDYRWYQVQTVVADIQAGARESSRA